MGITQKELYDMYAKQSHAEACMRKAKTLPHIISWTTYASAFGIEDDNYMVGYFSDGTKVVTSKNDYYDIITHNQKVMISNTNGREMQRDTLYIHPNGESEIVTKKKAAEYIKRDNTASEYITLKNGNTAIVTPLKKAELEREGKLAAGKVLWPERKTENNPYKQESKSIARSRPNIGYIPHKRVEEIKSFDLRTLLEQYIDVLDKIESVQDINEHLRSQLGSVEEPEIIEDLAEWDIYRTNRDSLIEFTNEEIEKNSKHLARLRQEKEYMKYLIYNRKDMPFNKWIRSGIMGVYVPEQTVNPVVDVLPWEKVLERLNEKSNQVAKEDKSDKALVTVATVAAVTMIVATIALIPFLGFLLLGFQGVAIGGVIDILALYVLMKERGTKFS